MVEATIKSPGMAKATCAPNFSSVLGMSSEAKKLPKLMIQ